MKVSALRNLSLGLVISTSAAFAVTASAAEVVPVESLRCTRDFNAWGHASRCACPSGATYDSRSAYCLKGELEAIQSQGEISTGLSAIGGETTGIVFQSNTKDMYELILPLRWRQQLEDADLSGLVYEVQGDYLEVPGVESGARPTIIVNTLTPVEDSSR